MKAVLHPWTLALSWLAVLALGACESEENPARVCLTHLRNLTLIIEDNAGNCNVTMREFNAYLQQNRQSMKDSIKRSDMLEKDDAEIFEAIMEEESPVVFKNFLKSKKSFEGTCRKKLPSFPYSELIGE